MIKLLGDNKLRQFDLDRKIEVVPRRCNTLEKVRVYDNIVEEPYTMPIKQENGVAVVDIPNILLQTFGTVVIEVLSRDNHGYPDKEKHKFYVEERPKPADYEYIETPTIDSGGGGGGGVQSDLSVNDDSDPAFVKGVIRQESLPDGYPFDSRQINTIEWDGDTTNKFVWSYSTNHDFCRVSDEVPFTAKNIIGQHIITNLSGMEEKDVIITEDMIDDRGSLFSIYNDSSQDIELVLVILDDTNTAQSAGVYFNTWKKEKYGNLPGEHVVFIGYESGQLEPMDDKFLPSVPGENLPAGTPWKNIDKIAETIFEHSFSDGSYGSMGSILYKNIPPAEGIADMTFIAGELYECIVNGNSFIMGVVDSTRLSGGNSAFAYIDIRVDTSNSVYNITFGTGTGTFNGGPIDVKLLHINEVVTNHPVCDAVPDAAGETPTAAEFNALLVALRNGGIISAE